MINHGKLGYGIIGAVILLQLYARFLPSPWAVLVSDDWANWARSLRYESVAEAAQTGLQDPHRPISMMAVGVGYHAFGGNPLPWTVLSVISNSLLLFFAMQMTFALTRRRSMAAAMGVVLAILPNLTETYHWSTQILNELTCALMFYALSGWMWVAYVRNGGWPKLLISALAYGIAVFSYEAGLLLPAAYLACLPRQTSRIKALLPLIPFGVIAVLYAAWRITDSFGLNQAWSYPSHMEAGMSLSGMWINLKLIMHWWLGDFMAWSVVNGWSSFMTITPWVRRLLLLGNLIVSVLVCFGMAKLIRSEDPAVQSEQRREIWHAVGFGLLWTGAAFAICLASYTASRLMVLPAIGIALMLAVLLCSRAHWGGWQVAVVPVFICLVATQGTSESYRQAGLANTRLFSHLERRYEEWVDKPFVLFDTSEMRQRLTPGLTQPISSDPWTWAHYGSAQLIRGFTLGGMLTLVHGERATRPRMLHDIEFQTRIEDDTLIYHGRFDTSRRYSVPMDDVYVVNVFEVISRP